MRISDWSSDVCSSDLTLTGGSPALLNAPSRRPNSVMASSTVDHALSSILTSQWLETALQPSARISLPVSSAAASTISAPTTFAPRRGNVIAEEKDSDCQHGKIKGVGLTSKKKHTND